MAEESQHFLNGGAEHSSLLRLVLVSTSTFSTSEMSYILSFFALALANILKRQMKQFSSRSSLTVLLVMK